MDQCVLFDYDGMPPPRPQRRGPVGDAIRYTSITSRVACEDCMDLYLDMADPPMARRACWRRETATGDRLLCRAHKEDWTGGESLEASRKRGQARAAKRSRYVG